MTAHLTIVAGPTGGGKTTTATRIETDTGARRLSADDAMSAASIDLWDTDARARIEAEQRALASELLRSGHDVVVEWGSWTRAERDELRDLARSAGAEVTLIWVDATPEELHRRSPSGDGKNHRSPSRTCGCGTPGSNDRPRTRTRNRPRGRSPAEPSRRPAQRGCAYRRIASGAKIPMITTTQISV